MKQYVVIPAYTDNYHIICVEDGKIGHNSIVSYYNMPGYCEALESQGYKKAYFLPKAKKELEEAKRAYLYAQSEYDTAVNNPLQISDEEAKKNMALAEILKPDDWDDFT